MCSRRHFLAILALGLVLALPNGIGAQEATPAATTFPVTPNPAECQVAPRTLDKMLALVAQAIPPGVATPPTSVVVPIGQPADAALRQAVVAVAREATACLSAADFPRFFALFTDGLVRRAAGEPSPLTAEDVRTLFAVVPAEAAPDRPMTLLAVTNVALIEDGRVGAFVVTDNPYAPDDPPDAAYWMLARVGERWLLDDSIDFSPDAADEGTPTP